MNLNLKSIDQQVIVITGASSGIGLCTARAAAKKGAKVFLVSRNRSELERICAEIQALGGDAANYAADVADAEALKNAAEQCVATFGRIDTWVNNAGVSIYGKLQDVPLEEKRRLFDTNFWGVIHGCRAAIPHLKESGGALINIGSVLSERAIPLQGIYVASKHAVKGYTDALRMELEKDGLPISVTLVEPAAINTPYPEHARNHMDEKPSLPAPIYSPRLVADAILTCAQKPRRTVQVGGAAKVYTLNETFAPGIADKFINATSYDSQKTTDENQRRSDSLFQHPEHEGREEGDYQGHVIQHSPYTSAILRPGRASMIAGASAAALAAAVLGLRSSSNSGKNLSH